MPVRNNPHAWRNWDDVLACWYKASHAAPSSRTLIFDMPGFPSTGTRTKGLPAVLRRARVLPLFPSPPYPPLPCTQEVAIFLALAEEGDERMC